MRLTHTLVLVGALAGAADAQTLVNPTRAEWTSADHAMVVRYDLAYYASVTATEPVTVVDVGKPSTCAPCTVPLAPKPILGGGLVARVRAVGADGAVSVWSGSTSCARRSAKETAGTSLPQTARMGNSSTSLD